jgi:soluble lytic murein transglycosylase-like protein
MIAGVVLFAMLGLYTAEKEYLPIIQAQSSAQGVPVALILATIRQESNFDPEAYREEPQINDASTGLMQILLKTAQGIQPGITEDQLYDPATNIRLGTFYLKQQLDRYGGNIQDAIAAYNAGTAYVYEDGSYANQNYVDKVFGYYGEYTAWIQNGQKTVDLGTAVSSDPVPFLIAGGILGVLVWKRKLL